MLFVTVSEEVHRISLVSVGIPEVKSIDIWVSFQICLLVCIRLCLSKGVCFCLSLKWEQLCLSSDLSAFVSGCVSKGAQATVLSVVCLHRYAAQSCTGRVFPRMAFLQVCVVSPGLWLGIIWLCSVSWLVLLPSPSWGNGFECVGYSMGMSVLIPMHLEAQGVSVMRVLLAVPLI